MRSGRIVSRKHYPMASWHVTFLFFWWIYTALCFHKWKDLYLDVLFKVSSCWCVTFGVIIAIFLLLYFIFCIIITQ